MGAGVEPLAFDVKGLLCAPPKERLALSAFWRNY